MNKSILFRRELSAEDEFENAKQYFSVGNVIEQRNGIKDSLVIGRYSTLPYYKELEEDLLINNSKLVNSYRQYSWIANFDWYEALKNYTFETWFRAVDLPDDGTKFVVKGKTNSRKHDWNKLMFAENKKRAIEIMIELNGDYLIAPQGVVFRRYEPLVTYEIGINGLRFTNEWRFFYYKGEILSYGYYWSLAEDTDKRVLDEKGLKLAKELGQIVKDYSNFFVLDIAEKENGDWVLVEVNDGQMSGLSNNDPKELYVNLSKCVANER
jgi:hypothetical protein